MHLYEDLVEKHFSYKKKESICIFWSSFYQNPACNCKSITLTLEGPKLYKGCCAFIVLYDSSDAYLSEAFSSQNYLNSHCGIQILFIELHCHFMNFNQHSSTCTRTHALKIVIFVCNLLLRKALSTNVWAFAQMTDTSSPRDWQFVTNTAGLRSYEGTTLTNSHRFLQTGHEFSY